MGAGHSAWLASESVVQDSDDLGGAEDHPARFGHASHAIPGTASVPMDQRAP